jgi:peptidyl-prolyl cis-trans isomerase B (cyclophilin B)
MFKEQNRIYWYLAGTVVVMVLFLFLGRDIVIPFLLGNSTSLSPGEFEYRQPPQTVIDTNLDYYARFDTNYGNFTVNLFEDNAPNNVNSLVFLANENYYDGTRFHRLIPGLLFQGGDRNSINDDPSDDGFGNPGYLIADEVNWDSIGLTEDRRDALRSSGYESTSGITSQPLTKYSLAMANTRPNSNANQFFIVVAAPGDDRIDLLQGQFTVIGSVISGRSVVDKIGSEAVDNPDVQVPRPLKDIVLNDVIVFTD